VNIGGTYPSRVNEPTEADEPEPPWLQAMRLAAVQRPRTQFVKIRWALLQPLLRERDALWAAASPGTRETIRAMRQADDYAYKRPRILHPADGPIKGGE
jgi:hypothetical protein